MTESSYIYMFFVRLSNWFSTQFKKSCVLGCFLTKNDNTLTVENSIFNKMFQVVIGVLSKLFSFIGLNRLFEGSIFKKPFIWCFITVTASPFLPTMVVLAMVAASFGSLLLYLVCGKNVKLKYYSINKYVYIYAGVYMFATLTSVTLKGSLFGGLLSVSFMLFFIVLINSVKTKRQMHVMLFFFIFAGIAVSLYGFYQYMFPASFSGVWHDKNMFEDIIFRAYSTFGNPNVLGEYLLLVIPVAFAYFLNSRKMFDRILFLGATGVMMLCLIITYSRGCYVGILVAFGIFLVLLDKRFIVLGLLGLLALPFVLPETILNRFLSIGNMADSSTSYRVYIWMGTIAMLKDYWMSGIGPGTDAFNKVYPSYAYNSISAPHSHNLFLQIICDAGICGIIMFIAVIYQYYKAAFSSLTTEKNKKNRVLIISGISSISGFLVQSLFDYTFYNYRVMLLFWIALAFGIIFTDISNLKEEKQHND